MQLSEIKDNFLQELTNSSQGKHTSLPYILNTIPSHPLVAKSEKFQILVIGGTYFCNASCVFENKKVQIISSRTGEQPTFTDEESFLSFVSNQLDEGITVLALNFAYPLNPIFSNNKLDGVLLNGTKENTFNGLVDKQIGQGIEQYCAGKGKKISVAVANDTICLLLSGLTQFDSDSLAAGVIGTGLNFAFFADKKTAINLESANFDKFELSEEAHIIDQHTTNPGRALFEKEVAGKYLYQHYNLILQKRGVDFSPITTTEQLDTIAKEEGTHSWLARELFKKSASLVACQIAAILDFQKKDLNFIMEGSLFWQHQNYLSYVQDTVRQLTQYSASFTAVDNSSVLGAAMLVGRE